MFKALIALKLSREAYAHKEDNLLDAVAYIGGLNNYLTDQGHANTKNKNSKNTDKGNK